MKLLTALLAGSFVFFSTLALAQDQDLTWTGETYDIVPNSTNVTEDYCKTHSLDTYKTNVQDELKVVTSNNGVTAKDVGSTTKKVGGIYMHTASVMLTGEADGKKWEEKAYFYYYGLSKDSPLQGIWYSKNCKGLYKSGPTA